MKLSYLAVSLISAGVASIATAYAVEKKMLKDYDERLAHDLEESVNYLEQADLAEATEEYQEKRIGRVFDLTKPSIEELIENNNQKVRYDTVLKTTGYSPTDAEPEVPLETATVRTEELGDIFTISTEEFMNNESGYLQSSLSYCTDGQVLDEEGDLVSGFEDLIGNTVPPFGVQSGEPHIVYLRNMKLRREFEVIQDDAAAADILSLEGGLEE